MGYRVHIDYFATDLTDLPVRDKRNSEKVLEILRKTKRFSTFDIDSHLGPTIERLFKSGEIKRAGGEYPWVNIEVVEP